MSGASPDPGCLPVETSRCDTEVNLRLRLEESRDLGLGELFVDNLSDSDLISLCIISICYKTEAGI